MTAVRSTFLRFVIGADAAACGLMGAAFAFDAGFLAQPLGLSLAFMQPVGLFLLVYAAGLVVMALRPTLPRPAVWALVAFNALWAIESIAIMALGWVQPTQLGVAFVAVQAVSALIVGDLQYLVLRRAKKRQAAVA
ncbi:hypothetical protein [Phenylobacterium sp.]|uniref:hypothetical protein n=1 Tax=Phenylobacterium sp. TaxID=1871053 RepID=UPI003D26B702